MFIIQLWNKQTTMYFISYLKLKSCYLKTFLSYHKLCENSIFLVLESLAILHNNIYWNYSQNFTSLKKFKLILNISWNGEVFLSIYQEYTHILYIYKEVSFLSCININYLLEIFVNLLKSVVSFILNLKMHYEVNFLMI